MGPVEETIASCAVAAAFLWAAAPTPLRAQATLNDAIGARAERARTGQDRLLVDAKEIVYNNDKNTVSASGDVELNYQGRTLQADRVTYDRNTGRVYAEGNARLTDATGAVITGDRFELTDDFKQRLHRLAARRADHDGSGGSRSRPAFPRRAPSAPRARRRFSSAAPTRRANPARSTRSARPYGR